MAIVKMLKMSLIGFENDRDDIMKALMKSGLLHITEITGSADKTDITDLDGVATATDIKAGAKTGNSGAAYDDKITRLKNAIQYLSYYSTVKKKAFESRSRINPAELAKLRNEEESIWGEVGRIEGLASEMADLKAGENRINSLVLSLKPWEGYAIPLDATGTDRAVITAGMIPAAAKTDAFIKRMEESAEACHVSVISEDRDQVYIAVIYHRDTSEAVIGTLQQYSFVAANFKGLAGTAAENLKDAVEKIRQIEARKAEIIAESRCESIYKTRTEIEILHDAILTDRDRHEAADNMLHTGKTFILEGWLPESESEKTGAYLMKRWECAVDFRKPEEGENHPVLLKNHALVQPFEVVTELYSLPVPGTVDPNLFLAPFYFVFFGMMVSDAGYGLLLALITGLVLLKLKPVGMAGKLVRLLFLGGISTFIWGVLFGGWFGNFIDIITSGRFTIPPLWFNPLDDPMKLLIWAFIFGTLHLFTGMGLKAYLLIKQKKYMDALFDVGFWYVLLIGLCLLAAGGQIAAAGKYVAIAGAALLVLTQGRAKKGIVGKFFGGVLSLYNVTGFLSDVLSYSRLLALGLATGVIATVINTMGTLFGFSPLGLIIFIAVFLVGTVFNLLINVLGAYVHASRLQYVEFFGKFYEGGGKAYNPFRIKTKYVDFINREEE